MSSYPNIAIIGAGPAGLTLGVLLQRQDIPFSIFDLESDPIHRDQGGTLDLHTDSGLLALREAGLVEEFEKHARPEGDALKLLSPSGKVLWDENNVTHSLDEDDGQRPEIDRVSLRQILLDAVGPSRIRWNKKLESVEPTSNDTYDLHFTDAVERGFNLVVGADGAWSKVRLILTKEQPFYSGVTLMDLWALNAENDHPWLPEFVGAGSCFMFDDGRAVIAQRNGNGSVRTYACIMQPESWVQDCGIDWTQNSLALRALVDRYFGDCGDDVKRMILEAEDKVIARPLYMLPVGITWASRPGITLVGDAAHLMTPFAGSGVNTAMLDALELAERIAEHYDMWRSGVVSRETNTHLAEAVAGYETKMFGRAKVVMEKTFKQMQDSFRKGGSEIMLEFMKKVRPEIADEAMGRKNIA